jgi:DNA-directed RNA polymerase specialized sigma24 family protein
MNDLMNEHHRNAASLPRNSGLKTNRINLGLAILSARARRGVCYTDVEIAAYCDCSPAMISSIAARAGRRLRDKLRKEFGLAEQDLNDPEIFRAIHAQP